MEAAAPGIGYPKFRNFRHQIGTLRTAREEASGIGHPKLGNFG